MSLTKADKEFLECLDIASKIVMIEDRKLLEELAKT